jgi:hypothetical protein
MELVRVVVGVEGVREKRREESEGRIENEKKKRTWVREQSFVHFENEFFSIHSLKLLV